MAAKHAQEELLQIRLPSELKKRLAKLAQDDDRSLSSYARKVLDEHVDAIDLAAGARKAGVPR